MRFHRPRAGEETRQETPSKTDSLRYSSVDDADSRLPMHCSTKGRKSLMRFEEVLAKEQINRSSRRDKDF